MHWSALLIIVVVEIIYLVAGGFIFWALESNREQEKKTEQRNFNFSGFLHNMSDAFPCVPIENLTIFVNQILTLERSGLLKSKESNDWDIHGSIFFAMTVVTTIGYGNVAPKTTGGQVFCCFYAIIGIPFTMVMLLGIGQLLKNLATKVHCQICPSKPRVEKIVNGAALTTVGIVLFLLVPAAIFTRLEGWGYGTAVYYGVITTTTVGFGDYVAAWSCVGKACWFYRISVGIWIFFGLAWLAGLIGAIQDYLQTLLSKSAPKSKKTDENDENNEKRNENGIQETSTTESDTTQTISVPMEDTATALPDEEIEYESVRL